MSEEEIRLDCLRLAIGVLIDRAAGATATADRVLALAEEFYAFTQGRRIQGTPA